MSLHKNCGWWKNSDCIFEFSVKSYVTNTINLSCAKILLPSAIILNNPVYPWSSETLVSVFRSSSCAEIKLAGELGTDYSRVDCAGSLRNHAACCGRLREAYCNSRHSTVQESGYRRRTDTSGHPATRTGECQSKIVLYVCCKPYAGWSSFRSRVLFVMETSKTFSLT